MFFKLPWFKKSQPHQYQDTQVLELDFVIDEFRAMLSDIDDPQRYRLQAALMVAQNPKDLWFLRSKVFNLISKHHCESVARTRITGLDSKLQFFLEHHPDYSPDELPTKPGVLH